MTFNRRLALGFLVVAGSFFYSALLWGGDHNLPGPNEWEDTVTDTIPITDRYGDYINDDQYNPFDILPSNVEQTVEYDPESGNYLIIEKIGDEYYRAPSYLTFEEYLEWRSRQQEREYFDKISGISNEYKSGSGKIDPLSKINIEKNLIDRLFGGNEISIEPQGNIDLTFGVTHNNTEAINRPISANRYTLFDFDMDIKMNVDGNIGDKMNLGFNYDTNASFDFDRKIKLEYDSEQFSEDDIIKKIEAGNVSLPLRSSLIQGAQSLFGIKMETQWGKLRLTGIASQQRSRQETLSVQNGATFQEFRIRPDEYDENRHFFISHYHRKSYEQALSNLPYINSNFRVTNIEVWISDDRPDYQQNQTMILALTDLAESEDSLLANPNGNFETATEAELRMDNLIANTSMGECVLPDNRGNNLFEKLVDNEQVKRIEYTASVLKSSAFNLSQPNDFEVFRGRKLSPSEYSFNPELGFISLNVRLRPNQVLSVSYEYFYTQNCDEVYKVGSITDEGSVPNSNVRGEVESEGVIFTKLLKSSTQKVNHPTWDLMMKNVYPLRTNQLNQADFKFDIFYEDDTDGSLKKFLPEPGVSNVPLLNVFRLDRLNSRNDPQPDGIFDFVPGVTVVPSSGSIIFPVLEPFGSSLEELIGDPQVAAKYQFQALYDTTVTIARENLVQNKFLMVGEYKSTISSEYSLGSWNIPQGSVVVRAGSDLLQEGVDYEVDYGIGRVRILNESYLQQGTPINISFEDNSLFSLQQKTMLGLRAEYEVNENFYIGGTYLRLFERPFTEKVNIGDDPINNRVFGLDMDFSDEAPIITRIVDKLPFYSTQAESSVNFTAEVAALKPGHSGAVNLNGSDDDSGVVSIDDFEGAVSGFPFNSSGYNQWILSSVPNYPDDPNRFPEADFTDVRSGYNRAKMSWHTSDRSELTDENGKAHSYTRLINQQELFNRQLPQGTLPYLFTFDLNYYPDERGPYNFDPPNGSSISAGINYDVNQQKVFLNDPESRWAGIMRYMPNSDFQAANYEFIEFWLLNPFLEQVDGSTPPPNEEGFLTFHLGNVSEDVLHDNLQFFENSLPNPEEEVSTRETAWGEVPLTRPTNAAFDQEYQESQDLGLDGLTDEEERGKFEDYINAVEQTFSLPPALFNDPAADNFVSYNDFTVFSQSDDLLTRYKDFNNPQGNSPLINDPNISQNQPFQRGNPAPDKEDLNDNYSLDQGESFFEYQIPIKNAGGEIDVSQNNFITQDTVIINPRNQVREKWYRFRIPLNEGDAINGIEGFRAIQFIRMIVNGFSTHKTFRMAEFELIRNQWRRLPGICLPDGGEFQGQFSIDAVGIEENQSKEPFGYVLPRGIQQQRVFSTFSNVLQDEKSLALRYCELTPNCDVSIYKLTELDLRVFERLQMFVHAESRNEDQEDGDVALYLRVGKDFDRHFYEYEIPLVLSKKDSINQVNSSELVWPEENMLDFALDLFIQAKKIRNVEGEPTTTDFVLDNEFIAENIDRLDEEFKSIFIDTIEGGRYLPEGHKVKIRGNPNLGQIKGIQIGLRNVSERMDAPTEGFCGEVWVNELRVTGLLERGGIAGLARLDVQLADLGNFSASGSYSSLGWGALDQKVNERAKEEVIEYDFASNLQLGKFFPDHWGLQIPFYAQYSKQIINPEFDAYDFDITVEDELDLVKNLAPAETDTIKQRNQTVRTIRTFNFTNVRKERTAGKQASASQSAPPAAKNALPGQNRPPQNSGGNKPRTPKPWDIENLSLSYAFTEVNYRDPILKEDNSRDYRLGLDYNYTRRAGFIQPFKKLKPKSLALIREININPLPNSFTFSSNINRFIANRVFRIPDEPRFEFDDRRFTWERRYDLNWNLTKSIKINYSAFNESYIDELRETGIGNKTWIDETGQTVNEDGLAYNDLVADDPGFVRDYWQANLRDLGRNTNYNQNVQVNYTLPLKYIPYMDWVDVKAQYRADYSWAAGPLIEINGEINPVGNIIQNGQNRSVTADLNFDRLYNKSKYIKGLDKIKDDKRRSRIRTSSRGVGDTQDTSKGEDDKDDARRSRKKEKEPGRLEKLLLRPLFMLRSVRLNYKEDFTTIIPGFLDTPEYIGLADGFSSPGVGFVFGIQPDISKTNPNNWLQDAANNKNWITQSSALNQPVIQTKSQVIDAKIKVEPWNDFKIDIDFSKNYQTNHTEEFRYKQEPTDSVPSFKQFGLRDMGSFEISYYSLNTLFGSSIRDLFNRFEENRSIISYRLPNNDQASHEVDGVEYAYGHGKQSSAVVVPAFLSAYTNTDPNTIDLDLESEVRSLGFLPRPNWKMRYDGLTKLPWFKDRFSSFTIEHGYSNKLRINNFMSDIEYDPNEPFDDTKINGNYYSRIEIPFVQINEQFNPIVGVKLKTKNDLNIDFSWVKTRQLDLSINTASELTETKKTEFIFGFGYTVKDSKFLKKKKKRRGSRTRQQDDEADDSDNPLDAQGGRRRSSRRNVSSTRGSDMTFQLNFGFSDNVTYVHRLDFGGTPDPTRGLKSITVSPSVDYIVNENLTVRAFIDYNATEPYISINPPVTNIEGGVTMRMTLN